MNDIQQAELVAALKQMMQGMKRVERLIEQLEPQQGTCARCGESFMLTKPNRRYCSDSCRNRAWTANR